jgi:hypothetical protein
VTLGGISELLADGIDEITNAACQITIAPPARTALNESGALLDTFLAVRPWWTVKMEPITEDVEFEPYQLTRHPPVMVRHLHQLALMQYPEDCSQHPLWMEQNDGSFWGSMVVLFQMYWEESSEKGAVYIPFGGNEPVGWPVYIEGKVRQALCPGVKNGFDCLFLKNSFCPIPANASFLPGQGHHKFSGKGEALTDEQFRALPRSEKPAVREIRSSFAHSLENRVDKQDDLRSSILQQ